MDKYCVTLSSNILRNSSHSSEFPKTPRFLSVLKDYCSNVPFYTIKMNSTFRRGPVLLIEYELVIRDWLW